MRKTKDLYQITQGIIQNSMQGTDNVQAQHESILIWAEQFIMDRRVKGSTEGTIYFYTVKLKNFIIWCDSQMLSSMNQLTPMVIRQYLSWLGQSHNPAGLHCFYRVVRTFCNWYKRELDDDWKNPMDKISSPKVPVEEILPIKPDEIQAIIDHCPAKTYMGDRDIAIMCLLLDTGARAEEFLNMNIADYNVRDGDILIRKGKGSKPRHVFVGLGSRKALRNWLKHRKDTCDAMWINNKGTRLEYGGLRGIIKRRGKNANVKASSIHDFRRSFAINFLRANPGEIMSLQKLMGHADLQILRRYLAQTTEDLKEAHMRGSPVDNFLHIR